MNEWTTLLDWTTSTGLSSLFFLLDVIAHILHHLKDTLLTELREYGQNLKASDFDWVITVPTIWKPKARKLMLEAGYMVSPKLKFVII